MADGNHNPFTPEQLDELRRACGLDPGAPELVVKAAVMLEVGMADTLIEDVDQVLTDEMVYLAAAVKLGWARWTVTIEDVDPD